MSNLLYSFTNVVPVLPTRSYGNPNGIGVPKAPSGALTPPPLYTFQEEESAGGKASVS